jgi:hypothetical protein
MLPELEIPSQVLGFSQTSSQNQKHIIRVIIGGVVDVMNVGLVTIVAKEETILKRRRKR